MNAPDRTRNAGIAPPPPAALARREPPSVEITRHMLNYLLSGSLAAGDRIPSERQLAESLGVGRSGVREAIKSLTLLGLLEVRHGDGTYLTGSTSDLLPRVIEWGLLLGERRVTDLTEARAQLEVVVAGLAAERRDDADVAELRRVLAMMAASDSVDEYIEADIAFHLSIAKASRNEVLSGLVSSIQALLGVWARRVLEAAGETETSLAMHEPIVAAVEQRDAAGARAAMEAHMTRATRRLRETLASDARA